MSIRRVFSLLGLTILSACASGGSEDKSAFHLPIPPIGLPTFGDGPHEKGELDKDVEAGKPALLWGDTSLGDRCVPVGETRVEVVGPPLHGVVLVKPGRMYALYPEGDRLAPCSGRLVTGTLAYYTAEKDFTGADRVALKATRIDGTIQQVVVNLTIYPAYAPEPARKPSPRPAPLPPIPKPTIRDPDAPAPTVLRTPYPGE
jgi:hypothetical protein